MSHSSSEYDLQYVEAEALTAAVDIDTILPVLSRLRGSLHRAGETTASERVEAMHEELEQLRERLFTKAES